MLLSACGRQTSTPATTVPLQPTPQSPANDTPTVLLTPANMTTATPGVLSSLTLGVPIRLGVGMSVRSSTGLELRVDDINDTRCPPSLECFWSGEVVVELTLTDQDGVVGRPSLHLYPVNMPPKAADWSEKGYSVSLLTIEPATRPQPDVPIEQYSMLLLVRQAEAQAASSNVYIPAGTSSPNAVIVPRSLVLQYLQNIDGTWSEQGVWQPLPQDIAALEAALPDFLRTAAPARSPELWKKFADYKRQYAGIIENERLLIHLNAFCDAVGKDWQDEPVGVFDGGDCYFRVVYNLQTGTFERLHINGEA